MEKSLLEKVLLYTGCHCLESLIVYATLIVTGGFYIGASLESINQFLTLVMSFILVSVLYFWKYTPEYKKDFFKQLEKKGVTSANLDCKDIKTFPLPKAHSHCAFFKKLSTIDAFKKRAPMGFDISFVFLCPDSVTIYTNCAKYHLYIDDVKVEKKGLRKVKTKKNSCADIFEYYYYNIMYVEYKKKSIVFHLSDGTEKSFEAAKKDAAPVIKEIRIRLRKVMQRKTIHAYEAPFKVNVESLHDGTEKVKRDEAPVAPSQKESD